jgi:hypothetical protein
MQIFGFITMDQIPNITQAMSGAPYRRLVYNQHLMCLDILKDELIASKKVNFKEINLERDVLCVCDQVENHNCITRHKMTCCGAVFEKTCLTDFINTLSWCPYCGEKADSIEEQLASLPMPSRARRSTDLARAKSAEKKREFQVKQGEKMKKRYNDSMKDAARAVTVGAVVTIWVDPRVASHARGVMAIVYAAKETGGILACSDGGIIVNGMTKKEWWIAADGYALKATHDEIVVLSPNLEEVRKQVLAGTFSAKKQKKCSLSQAHQVVVGASSPCLKSTCQCKKGQCGNRCGCFRNNRACSSTCSCSGKCKINELNKK